MCDEFVSARKDAVEWLKKHYPALCEKSGLCERIGGRLYLRSTLTEQRQHIASAECWCGPVADYVDPDTGATVFVHQRVQ